MSIDHAHEPDLHPALAADTLPVCTTEHSRILLMNDSRWPWFILVPVTPDIEELHDLTHLQRDAFMADVNQVSRVVKTLTLCRSVNVAMLGNAVSQLHCHVVARDMNDANWPKPVWGFETAVPYAEKTPTALLSGIRKSFS